MRPIALALLLALGAADAGALTQAVYRAPTVSASQVAQGIGAYYETLVDIRPDESFMGWRAHGERRGGHIPGAVHLPAEWIVTASGSPIPDAVRHLFNCHGRSLASRVVLAGDEPARLQACARAIRAAGCRDVAVLAGGMHGWLEDPSLPVESLPGYRMFVSPVWLATALAGGATAEPPAGPVVVLEASWGGEEKQYDRGHIPGALHVDTGDIEADEAVSPRGYWRLRPAPQIAALLARLGVSRDTTVVVYSDPNMAAARVAWMLLWAGVRDVRLLNGGMRAWTRSGGAIQTTRVVAGASRDFGATIPQRPELRRDTQWVRERLLDPRYAIADVRTWDEHIGRSSGYDNVTGKGRIPGALFANGGITALDLVGSYEDPDGTLRAYTEVERMWARFAIHGGRSTTYHCGTGWRASVAFLFGYAMGRPEQAVYDSGWMDWSMGPDAARNPVSRGAPTAP